MSPLADAVVFVDRDQPTIDAPEKYPKTLERKPFGRYINELELPLADSRDATAQLISCLLYTSDAADE